MALHANVPTRFVKHVVRSSTLHAAALAPGSAMHPVDEAAPARVLIKRSDLTSDTRSGIEPLDVIIVVGGLGAIFLLLVSIGGICKLVNRPRAEARHQINSRSMFQPSAAGYGARKDDSVRIDAPGANLLDAASPMGMGGNSFGDSSADLSLSMDSPPRGSHTHVRGKSSGVNFPGAPTAFRRGTQPQHPPLDNGISLDGPVAGPSFSSAGPDGSGFRPGQRFDYGRLNDGLPRGPTGAPNGYAPRQTSLRNQRPLNRGPPPAVSRSRSGRYAQQSNPVRKSRIDSVGPGTYRKSMFMTEDPGPSSNSGPPPSGGLRRVESIGKGDPRRKSHFMGGRGASFYGSASASAPAPLDIRSAREDGWGSGQRSPGLSTPGVGARGMGPLGPLGPSDTSALDPYDPGPYDQGGIYDHYSNDAHMAYSNMQTGYSGMESPVIGNIWPSSGMHAVEGVGSGSGGRRII